LDSAVARYLDCGCLSPIPYVDPAAAERLFRHKVFAFLLREELITLERVELLSSWRNSGFSVHNAVHVAPDDGRGVEALIRYMMRPPVPGPPMPKELHLRTPWPRASDGQICSAVFTKSILWPVRDAPQA
jgi:hypothetical protein